MLVETAKVQRGGNPSIVSSSFMKKFEMPSKMSTVDISLDAMFEAFLTKMKEQDRFWSNFAEVTPGISRRINQMPDIPVAGVPISPRAIVTVIILIIDSLRMSLAVTGSQGSFARVTLTLLVLIEEIATGQWRQAIFTSAGLYSNTGVAIGILGKYIINGTDQL
jgi:hypothetical protein